MPLLQAFLAVLALKAAARQTIHVGLLHQEGWDYTHVTMPYMLGLVGAPGNRTLLPDYEVEITVFSQHIEVGASQDSLARLLRPGNEKYVAVIGPFDNLGPEQTIRMSAASRILPLHEGDAPQLSDREKYPYSFRGSRSSFGHVTCWYWIIAQNGWNITLSLWQTSGERDSAWRTADAYGIVDHGLVHQFGDILSQVAVQEEGLGLLRNARMRTVVTFLGNARDIVPLACDTYVAGFRGLQWFAHSGYLAGWWTQNYTGVECTSDELFETMYGYITVTHTIIAPGTNFFNFVQVPNFGATDESVLPLTCAPQMTPASFFNDPTVLALGIASGIVVDVVTALDFLSTIGVHFDMLCAVIHALHDTLYRKQVPLEQLENREEVAFESLVASMQQVSFFGPTGYFSYYPNSGDPIYKFFWSSQFCKVSKANDTVNIDGYLTFPNGIEHAPELVLTEGYVWEWRDGSTGLGPKPHLNQYPDCLAVNGELVGERCRACDPGHFMDIGLLACRRCPAGEYQSGFGKSTCEVARPGSFVPSGSIAAEALPCPRGFECEEAGMLLPSPCARGTFSAVVGRSACDLCPSGQYQDQEASSECQSCEAKLSRSITGSSIASSDVECQCPGGSYFLALPEGGNCLACPAGMDCAFGSNSSNFHLLEAYEHGASLEVLQNRTLIVPWVRRGYMTLSHEPLRVFRCAEEGQCPGGSPGSCGTHRDGTAIACGRCVSGAYQDLQNCKPCGRGNVMPFVVAMLLIMLVLVATTFAVSTDMHKVRHSTIGMVTVTGLLFISLQSIGAFNQIEITWEEPMASILFTMQLLTFDLRLLKIECLIGPSTGRSFGIRLLVPPVSAIIVFTSLCLKKYLPVYGQRSTRIVLDFTNAIGTVFNIFFISLVVSCMTPYLCYEHPSGNGESVLAMPSILCFDSEIHTIVASLGVAAFLTTPIPFLALCMLAVYKYPGAMRRHNSNDFLHATRFLFFRFHPSAYFFQLFILLRSLLIGIVPAVLRAKPGLQITVTSLLLGLYLCVQQEIQPWKGKLCNMLDGLLSATLLLVLVCAANFMEDQGRTDMEDLSILAGLSLLVILCLVLTGLALAFWRRNVRRGFDFFICHHKADAAAQARLLKLLLVQHRSVRVFLDSDNLENLDELYDIVSTQIRHLVMYLSADTLRRPWCAGEIATAWRIRARIRRTRVACESFVDPSEDELSHVDLYIDASDCNLTEYGITWTDVERAYRDLAEVTRVRVLEEVPGTSRFAQICQSLCLRSGRLHNSTFMEAQTAESISQSRQGGVVLAAVDDNEGLAAGVILAELIRQPVYGLCAGGLSFLPDWIDDDDYTSIAAAVSQSRAVVVVLAASSMFSTSQLLVMSEAVRLRKRGGHHGIVPVVTPNFEIPGRVYYVEQLPDLIETRPMLSQCRASHFQSIFNIVSIYLPTHASQIAIQTQIDTVISRLKQSIASLLPATSLRRRGFGSRRSLKGSGSIEASPSCRSIKGSGSVSPSSSPPSSPRSRTGVDNRACLEKGRWSRETSYADDKSSDTPLPEVVDEPQPALTNACMPDKTERALSRLSEENLRQHGLRLNAVCPQAQSAEPANALWADCRYIAC